MPKFRISECRSSRITHLQFELSCLPSCPASHLPCLRIVLSCLPSCLPFKRRSQTRRNGKEIKGHRTRHNLLHTPANDPPRKRQVKAETTTNIHSRSQQVALQPDRLCSSDFRLPTSRSVTNIDHLLVHPWTPRADQVNSEVVNATQVSLNMCPHVII